MITIHIRAYNVTEDIAEVIAKVAPLAVEAAAAGSELVDEMCLCVSFTRSMAQDSQVEIGYQSDEDDERSHKVGSMTSFAVATVFDRMTQGHKDRKAKFMQRAKKAAAARWSARTAPDTN